MKEASKARLKDTDKDTVISYSDAVTELEAILESIESGDADIDQLSDKVKRALFLVKLCKSRLRATDEEIRKIMEEFNDDTSAEEESAD